MTRAAHRTRVGTSVGRVQCNAGNRDAGSGPAGPADSDAVMKRIQSARARRAEDGRPRSPAGPCAGNVRTWMRVGG
jgi:hypothetical protein